MDFTIGNYYTFSTLAPAILGQEHRKMLLMAIGDYRLASMFDNVDVKLNAVAGYLGQDSNMSASKDVYLVFRTETNAVMVFGKSWLNMATVESASTNIITVTVEGASNDDASRIRQILARAGYNKVTTTVKSIT